MSNVRRLIDWLLCRPEIEQARSAAKQSPREEALLSRAKSALAAANHLLEAPERTGHGLAGAHAAVLYLESLYWSLLSSRADLERPDFDLLWTEARSVVDNLGLTAEEAAEVKRFVAMPRPALELPELSERDQEAAAMALRHAATRAIRVREKEKRAAERVALKRLLRLALALIVLVGIVIGIGALMPAKRNLAAGKPWAASSKLFDCHPNAGECGGVQTKIFFHTKEEVNPWVRFDLGTKSTFSSMTVTNRLDGERGRAMPLIVEASDDGKNFREVIRRGDEFSVWKPSFAKQSARYVRVRVPRKSILHLEGVQVHP